MGTGVPAGLTLRRIKARRDFLHAQRAGVRFSRPGLGVELCATPEEAACSGAARVGFTASRKVGGAVQRNRAKRRLRAAAADIVPRYGRELHDYVFVARAATLSRSYRELLEDMTAAIAAAHAAANREAVRGGKNVGEEKHHE